MIFKYSIQLRGCIYIFVAYKCFKTLPDPWDIWTLKGNDGIQPLSHTYLKAVCLSLYNILQYSGPALPAFLLLTHWRKTSLSLSSVSLEECNRWWAWWWRISHPLAWLGREQLHSIERNTWTCSRERKPTTRTHGFKGHRPKGRNNKITSFNFTCIIYFQGSMIKVHKWCLKKIYIILEF